MSVSIIGKIMRFAQNKNAEVYEHNSLIPTSIINTAMKVLQILFLLAMVHSYVLIFPVYYVYDNNSKQEIIYRHIAKCFEKISTKICTKTINIIAKSSFPKAIKCSCLQNYFIFFHSYTKMIHNIYIISIVSDMNCAASYVYTYTATHIMYGIIKYGSIL